MKLTTYALVFENRIIRLLIICFVLLVSTYLKIAHSAEKTSEFQAPVLPEIPFNYIISDFPDHLKDPLVNNPIFIGGNHGQYNHLATLGRVLFYDKYLSKNNLVSCSSCHKQDNGFDDISRFSIGFRGKITVRNSMGLVNAVFNHNRRYFWDERAASLEDQVMMPFFDPVEMGLKKAELLTRIKQRPYYRKLFANAFGKQEISRKNVAAALAGFLNSLVSFNSLYDRARSEVESPQVPFPAFSVRQNRGKDIFFKTADDGGAGCTSCHITENFISLPSGSNNGLDRITTMDQGIGAINNIDRDMGNFRPPSLRNISIRAPFMHDGRFETLEEVIDHYSTGIKKHTNLGDVLKDEKGNPRRFEFTPIEKDALFAFLETLNDSHIRHHPKFSDPFRP